MGAEEPGIAVRDVQAVGADGLGPQSAMLEQGVPGNLRLHFAMFKRRPGTAECSLRCFEVGSPGPRIADGHGAQPEQRPQRRTASSARATLVRCLIDVEVLIVVEVRHSRQER